MKIHPARLAAFLFFVNLLDWDEFDFAFRKLAEHLGVHPMDVWAFSKPGFKPPEHDIVPMTEGLTGEVSLELSLVLSI